MINSEGLQEVHRMEKEIIFFQQKKKKKRHYPQHTFAFLSRFYNNTIHHIHTWYKPLRLAFGQLTVLYVLL